jgi:RNA polymerase-binding transcription factor DksA
MATKKPAPKKPAAKPAAKKAAKPAPKKPAAKPAAKKPAPKAKPVAKKVAKPAPKKVVAKAKPIVKKAAPKPAPQKVIAKPAPKAAVKPAPKKVEVKTAPVKVGAKPVVVKEAPKPEPVKAPVVAPPPPPPIPKKGDPASLVSIKPKAAAITKKEPPKPSKVVIPKTTVKSSVKYEPEFTKSVLDLSMMQQHSGPTMRYSDSDLTEFREIIQRKLDAAKKELSYLQGLITRKDEGGDMDEGRYMTMEDGSVSMEREQLSQMASRQITFIDHLEKAMMRIENKTYGVCRVTGKLIDKARLKAVPHATLSIEAKQMMNK